MNRPPARADIRVYIEQPAGVIMCQTDSHNCMSLPGDIVMIASGLIDDSIVYVR